MHEEEMAKLLAGNDVAQLDADAGLPDDRFVDTQSSRPTSPPGR
jgi:hypothetical protein